MTNANKVRDKDGVVKDMYDCLDVLYCSDLIKAGKGEYPYPEEWMQEHYIAMINEMFIDRGETQWLLMIDKGGAEIPIDVENTEWGGQRGDGAVTGQELDGWTQEYLATSKIFACCIQDVSVDLEKREVSVTLDGELALRAAQMRQGLISQIFSSFQSRLGECLRRGRLVNSEGRPFPDTYTNPKCP